MFLFDCFRIYWFYMQIRRITDPNKTLFTLTQTFRYLNCCCNVFLYSATSSLFRRELKEIFKCSKSSKNPKTAQTTQITLLTQPRTPSSTALYSANIDNTSVERKKLLVTNSPSELKNPIKTTCISGEPNNGHAVSFKI